MEIDQSTLHWQFYQGEQCADWHIMGCLQSFRKLILLGPKFADFNWNISITWWYAVHPASAVDAGGVVDLPLAEVDQVGVEEDAHRHQDDQQPQLLVGLLQGVKQGLKASKVTDKFKYSEVKVSIAFIFKSIIMIIFPL